jgi:hypothetical protein
MCEMAVHISNNRTVISGIGRNTETEYDKAVLNVRSVRCVFIFPYFEIETLTSLGKSI